MAFRPLSRVALIVRKSFELFVTPLMDEAAGKAPESIQHLWQMQGVMRFRRHQVLAIQVLEGAEVSYDCRPEAVDVLIAVLPRCQKEVVQDGAEHDEAHEAVLLLFRDPRPLSQEIVDEDADDGVSAEGL